MIKEYLQGKMAGIKSENKHLISKITPFHKGLALQREHYKIAKTMKDWDSMRNCLENIKMEIKQDAIKRSEQANIRKVESVIAWYDNLPSKFTKIGPDGPYIDYPPGYEQKVNLLFTAAYEILISLMGALDLL